MNKNIKNIDFDSIKQNLITFFKSQEKFSSYNFEASGLNILLDVLAYNTYYQSFYNNMTFNEMFLDSAVKRSSVVSLAKMLGYTPASTKAATCSVEVFSNNIATQTLLPKYTIFKTSVDNETYEFVTLNDNYMKPYAFNSNGTVSQISTGVIQIKQGKIKTVSFIHDIGLSSRKYTIISDNIDVSTISITVQNSETDSTGLNDLWERANDITKITGNSNSYYLEENTEGYYYIYFGDGVLGKKLSDGNKIIVTYLETSGSSANGIGNNDNFNTFIIPGLGYSSRVLSQASGGEERESKESIRIKAPKSFSAQERAVTLDDYKTIIMKDFPDLKSISCWGGEDNDPPRYGKVFLSIKPKNGNILSLDEKTEIVNSLIRGKNIVGIEPVIVDPEVLYILLEANIKIDPEKLKYSIANLKNKINKQILLYISENIEVFDGDFFSNELINMIDGVDESIYSIDIITRMEKRFIPDISQSLSYYIHFRNPILHSKNCDTPTISSSSFYYYDGTIANNRLCTLEDNMGIINIVYTDNTNVKTTLKSIGKVDYFSGLVQLENFLPVELNESNQLSIYALPNDKDVYSDKNNLIVLDILDTDSLNINIRELPYRGRL